MASKFTAGRLTAFSAIIAATVVVALTYARMWETFLTRLRTYESIAIWLEGIALVAIFVLDWKERKDQRKDREEQHKETLAQLNVSQAQADALINSERAWVLVSIENVPTPTANDLGTMILPIVRNYGRTTARIVKFALRQQQFNRPDGLQAEPVYQGENAVDFILPPNTPIQPMSVGVSHHEYEAARNATSFLYVYGYIDYVDVGEKRRQTRFCFMYYPQIAIHPLPDGFYIGIQAPAAYTKCT